MRTRQGESILLTGILVGIQGRVYFGCALTTAASGCIQVIARAWSNFVFLYSHNLQSLRIRSR
jgi:hypothetical protein